MRPSATFAQREKGLAPRETPVKMLMNRGTLKPFPLPVRMDFVRESSSGRGLG